MARKISILLFLIFSTSFILNSVESNPQKKIMETSCELDISHSTLKPCCCNMDYQEFQVNISFELPVFVHNIKKNVYVQHQYTIKKRLIRSNEFTSFYTPLKKIRLII